ncbi:MAG: helix-turn-helix transcriptional regulator [Armatimonadetes bacterium]|nr:helix-turn-helix transcriptional regulator [Armatimonadota bacterium]
MNTFGQRLKVLREEKKLSQEELGKIFHLSQSTIAYYEKDKKQPSQKTLQKFADFFNVSVDYLLGRTNNPKPAYSNYFDTTMEEISSILSKNPHLLKFFNEINQQDISLLEKIKTLSIKDRKLLETIIDHMTRKENEETATMGK